MKDSSSKSRLSDEGVRKKEPSVSKIETKELSEPKLKPSQSKAKIDALASAKIKSVKRKLKIKKGKPSEAVEKLSIMRKKTVDSSFVAKASPKTESIKKEQNSEKEKLAVNQNVATSCKDIEVDLHAFEICKIPEKKRSLGRVDVKKESTRVSTKKRSAGVLEADEKNNPQKSDKELTNTREKRNSSCDETRKGSSTKFASLAINTDRRKRLSLKEEKLLVDARKSVKMLKSEDPAVSKEGSEVQVDSGVTIVEDIVPLKKSRDRKQSFKARELSIQHIAKTTLHANQTKDINPAKDTPSAHLSKHVLIESLPVKIKTEPKVAENTSEKKEPAVPLPMLKFTYEKSMVNSDSPTNEKPSPESLPDLVDAVISPIKHEPPPDESLTTLPTPTPAEFSTDIESQLLALEDGFATDDAKPAPSTKGGAPPTPVKTDTPEGFQPGARMEALEISTNKWYSVKVVEVDWTENEVLIHFEKWSQRFDEWIQMDSSRLRPCEPRETSNEKLYHVGETVMATWMNSQKYPAKVKKMLNNDFLEVLFFDGFTKTMRTNKIAKCVGNEGLEPILPPPPPTLMSKLERRECKRKIQSVAELFHMKKKKYKTKKSDAGIETKSDLKTELEENLSKQKNQKYTDLTNISDNEGEKTYIDLNTSFIHDDGMLDLSETKGENDATLPAVPTKRPYKRKKYPTATNDNSSPESSTPKEGTFPFKGRKNNEAIGSDYDSWEPEGEEAYVVETADGLRRSLVVKDERLPAGWAKHTIQRRSGNSAGKWDVFLVSPGGRRFRSRKEMQAYFSDVGEEYRPELFDFTLRCNMRRKRDSTVYVKPNLKKRSKHVKLRKHKPTLKLASSMVLDGGEDDATAAAGETPQRKYKIVKQSKGDAGAAVPGANQALVALPSVDGVELAEDVAEGTVFIGNLQVQLDQAGAYVCPSAACSKHFRRENLLQMHIKHYHPELSAFVGSTPNVADLAYARTVGAPVEDMALGGEYFERLHRVEVAKKQRLSTAALSPPSADKKPADKKVNKSAEPTPTEPASPADRPPPAAPAAFPKPKPATSTPLRDLLRKESVPPLASPREQPKAGVTAGIKTLLPIVRTAPKLPAKNMAGGDNSDLWVNYPPSPSDVSIPSLDGSYHKQKSRKRRLSDAYMDGIRKRKHLPGKLRLEDGTSDVAFSPSSEESSFLTPTAARIQPGSMKKKNPLLSASLSRPLPDYVGIGIPELAANSAGLASSAAAAAAAAAAASSPMEPMTEEQLNKRDIINCTCGVMEEDGLMIQCDLCLCWQHGYCNNIERENEVPDKYVCYICRHPARERMSTHYLHDQDWLNEGVLPSLSERTRNDPVVANRTELLRKSHSLAAGLLQLQTAIKSLRVKVNVANTPDHPKLYLWAKPWEKCVDAKMEQPCIEPNLLTHGDPLMSVKDEAELDPQKPAAVNGQFVPDLVGETQSAAASSAASSAGSATEKEMPKMPDGQMSALDVKEEVEDAGNGANQCKTEPESADAIDAAKTKPNFDGVADPDVRSGDSDEKTAEFVPTNVDAAMDIGDSKEATRSDQIEMPNSTVSQETKQAVADEGKESLDGVVPQTHLTSTPLMDGVASTSSQVPLIESSLQSKHFNADKSLTDMDTNLLLQALTHGNQEPVLTNGTDLSNGHLDASHLLNFPISNMELLRFANSIADNIKAAAVGNLSHPSAPEPEKPIDPRECRLLLLDHIELKQREVKHQLEILEDQLAVLEAEDPEPPGEETLEFFPQTKQTVKMLLRDLNTLKKISEIN